MQAQNLSHKVLPPALPGWALWMVALGMVAAVVTDGNMILMLVPVLVVGLLTWLWSLSISQLCHGLLFLCLLIDNPTERPGRNLFRTPLYVPGTFIYEMLSKSAHVPIKATGLQLVILLLLSLAGLRSLFSYPQDGPWRLRTPAATPMVQFAIIAMLDLVWLWVYGMGRGGAGNYATLQMQTMFYVPLMTLLFCFAFKTQQDVKRLLSTFMFVGIFRALMCLYYWVTFMRHQGVDAGGQEGDGSYVTTHSDSILATVAIVICIVRIYQQPAWRHFLFASVVVPIVGLGIVANNRRIAFVAIALGLFFSYLAGGKAFKRRVHQTLLVTLPVGLLYIAAGWSAHGSWAKPVQSLRSVIEQKDSSSATRDIENFNLLLTLKQHPMLGSGFGHMYIERIRAFDISSIFQAYRYVPHNSILWFWGAGGVVGFSFFFLFLSVGVFLAARTIHFSASKQDRVLGMVVITSVCAYGAQSFGDMGLMSWMGGLIVSSSLGAVASAATRVGAWTPPGVVARPQLEGGITSNHEYHLNSAGASQPKTVAIQAQTTLVHWAPQPSEDSRV